MESMKKESTPIKYETDDKRLKKRSSTNLRFEFSPRIEILPESRRQSKRVAQAKPVAQNQQENSGHLKINKAISNMSKIPKLMKKNNSSRNKKYTTTGRSSASSSKKVCVLYH